jgi:hypothetical protein
VVLEAVVQVVLEVLDRTIQRQDRQILEAEEEVALLGEAITPSPVVPVSSSSLTHHKTPTFYGIIYNILKTL